MTIQPKIFAAFIFLLLSNYCLADEKNGSSAFKIEEPADIIKEMTSKEAVNIKTDPYFQQLIKGVNRLAFDLYQNTKDRRGNIYFSSYALAIGLNMVGLGSGGESASEIRSALNYSVNLFPLIHDLNHFLGANVELSRDFMLSVADAIWLEQGFPFLPSFQISIGRGFKDGLQFADFNYPSKAIQSVNSWVSRVTNGAISQILTSQDITRTTRLILATAFFLKGEWSYSFDRMSTKKMPFNYRGHAFQVEMMKQVADLFVLQNEKFDIIEMPFKGLDNGAAVNMTIFLPKKEIELSSFDSELNAEQWEKWMKLLSSQQVELGMPKFRVSSNLDFDNLLKKLGVRQIFEQSADFSGISEKESVYLNQILHKTSLRIDESGSNAGFAYANNKIQHEKAENTAAIVIDRPFFFVIQDKKSGLILGLGRIEKP